MRTEFDDLRLNPDHHVVADNNGDKQIVKIYFGEKLIAKRIKQKKTTRYFASHGYQQLLTGD